MKHYIYKTTNTITGKYYIGKHSSENIQKDPYIGSGLYLLRAIKKYGKKHFKREILFQYDNEIDAFEKERELVTQDFVLNNNNYNFQIGGKGGMHGMVMCRNERNQPIKIDKVKFKQGSYSGINRWRVTVKDENGNTQQVATNCQEYINGVLNHNLKGSSTFKDQAGNTYNKEIINITNHDRGIKKGMVNVIDSDGNSYYIDINDPDYKSGKLKHVWTDTVLVKDSNGKKFHTHKNDERLKSGELVGHTKGFFTAINPNTKEKFRITREDPRWISGQLVGLSKGTKRNKICLYPSSTSQKAIYVAPNEVEQLLKLGYVYPKDRVVNIQKFSGNKSSRYGTMWITNVVTEESKCINANEPIPDGYKKGRNMKYLNGK